MSARKRIKRLIKTAAATAAGRVMLRMPPLKDRGFKILGTWLYPKQRSAFERLMFPLLFDYWCRKIYLAEGDPDRRDALKDAVMGGEHGRHWAEHYQTSPIDMKQPLGTMTFETACPMLPAINERLGAMTEPCRVLQIGSSSGRELAWLASRHPRHSFIGTDIYPEIVRYAAGYHALPNLSFSLVAAKDVPAFVAGLGPGPVAVLSAGSLQYVQPEHVQAMFEGLGALPQVQASVIEPVKLASEPLGLEGSAPWDVCYSHNYRWYAERAGLKTLDCRVITPYEPPEEHPNHEGVGHYYYLGTT